MDRGTFIGVGQERMGALCRINTLAAPDGVDNLLARARLDEELCFAHDGEFDSVAHPHFVVKVVKVFVSSFENVWGSATEYGPRGDEDSCELEDV